MVESTRKEGPWTHTYWGYCGHVRQEGLPCATPSCREGASLSAHGFMRTLKFAEGSEHYLWVQIKR